MLEVFSRNKLCSSVLCCFILFILFLTQFGLDELVEVFPVIERVGRDYRVSGKQNLTPYELLNNRTSGKQNLTPYELLKNRIFVRSAFLIDNTEIRLTIVKHHKNSKAIYFDYGGEAKGKVDITCNLPKCIDGFSPSCILVGHIGIIKFTEFEDTELRTLTLSVAGSDQFTIDVTDVRKKPEYEHQLGVCVQPIFMFAAFPGLIQFFEHWLLMGATKFYIYQNSYSNEVQAIMGLYQQTSNASIELIDWSDLPSNSNIENPNSYWYRLEVMISIFDCVQRARYNVKYIAQTDLDEMFILNEQNGDIVSYMDSLMVKHPEMASASFVSRRAKLPAEFENITSPYDVDFMSMEKIYVENYYFPRPVYTKLIRIPDRSFHSHIHYSLLNEKQPDSNKEFETVEVSKRNAYILHMRRITSQNYKVRRFDKSDLLASDARYWDKAFKHRLSNYTFPIKDWENSGLDVLKTIEECRRRHETTRLEQCHSLFDCSNDLDTQKWFKVNNSWLIL